MTVNQRILSGGVITMVLGLFGLTGAVAQDVGVKGQIDEVVVTARRREENLNDVPVAITVMNDNFIVEAGILDAYDLFDAAVGFEYDTGWGDRNTATPGVRGVQGNGLGVTQQKMNSFLDGFPLVGQQGSLQFDDVQRVELYRGPQSAAFGRATFAGAINYVSRDPSEEFEAKFEAGVSSQERREAQLSLGGPITDTLGFTLDASHDEWQGPDEWISSDGYHLSATSTDYISTKLVWEPSDKFMGKLRYINSKADDRPGNRYYPVFASSVDCANTTLNSGALYYKGEVDSGCALKTPATGIGRNHDVPASAGLVPGDLDYELALSRSVLDPYARDERERFQLELDFAVGESNIVVLAMHSTEYFEAWQDSDNSSAPPTFSGGPNSFGGHTTVGPSVSHMANPYDVTENYYEVRWVSPVDKSFRWMLGATDYEAKVPGFGLYETAGMRLGLDGVAIQGRPFTARNIYGDQIFNTGVFGSVAYDLSDRVTVSLEARYQEDLISNVNYADDNQVLENETKSTLPRLSVTYKLNDDLTLYGQFAKGANPGGVNIGYTAYDTIDALEVAHAAGWIEYDSTTFRTYVEEELTNYEFGLKGSALGNRLAFTSAIYALEWNDQTNIYTVDWDGPWNDGSMSPGGVIYGTADVTERTTLNEGTIKNYGVEFEGTYFLSDAWSLNGNLSYMNSEYTDFCDVLATGGSFQLPVDGTSKTTGVGCHVQDGNTPPNLSKVTYNLGFAYRAPLGVTDWRLAARLDLRHSGPQYMDSANIMEIGARDLLNGSISVSNENWTAQLWATNLTDDDTPRNVGLGRDAGAGGSRPYNFIVTPQRPREYGLRLSYRF